MTLIEQAKREGKWLYCRYQGLWFSPNELEEHQAKGQFRWGDDNFTLADPDEFLQRRLYDLQEAQTAYNNALRRVSEWKKENSR